MATSTKAAANRPAVTDFPWDRAVTQHPVLVYSDAKTQDEFAYNAGRLIERVRAFIEDDDRTEMINWGLGPTPPSDAPSPKPEEGVGTFGIFAAIKPADLDLYRALLPVNFSMPAEPVLSLANLDYNQPNPIFRYREGMVLLKAIAPDGAQTWYCHGMPVESWVVLAAGHAWGFRKRMFDMTVTRERSVVLEKNGELYMSLELTPFAWSTNEGGVIPDGGVGGIDDMATVYPLDPGLVLRFVGSGGVAVQEENRRQVKITVNRSLDWAGLVPEGAVAPGLYQRVVPKQGNLHLKKIRA